MIRRIPAQPEPFQQLGADVGQFAKDGVKNDRHYHHVGLQKFTRVHRQIKRGDANPQLDTILKVLAPLGKTLAIVPLQPQN